MIAGGVVHKGGFQGFPEKSLKFGIIPYI